MMSSMFNLVSEVTDHLYLSAARAVRIEEVRARGITCIVNATIEIPNLPLNDIDYIKVQIDDSPFCNIYSYFDSIADKIQEVKKRKGRTLVHCIAGVSRSASLCIAYLMKYEGMTLRKAYYYVKSKRPIIRPNDGFFRQLIDYERKLFASESVKLVKVTSVAGPDRMIPDVYVDEYKNLIWLSGKRNNFSNTSKKNIKK
ncbi:DUSP14 (predicted) [Pycnogonum litorale]